MNLDMRIISKIWNSPSLRCMDISCGEGRLYEEGSQLPMIQAGAWHSLLVATGQARAEHGTKVRSRGWAGHCTPSHKPEPGPDMRSDKVNIDCGPAWGVERELAWRRTGSGGHMTWRRPTGQPPALVMTLQWLKCTSQYSDNHQI